MHYTAEEVYNRLVDVDRILTIAGQIRFTLGEVSIIVRQKDVVGNILQEWLEGWLEKNGIEFARNPNTQMPPDLFLNPEDRTTGLLEVKAFNYEATPGFDIADFKAFQKEIIEKPYMLYAQYLIFGDQMADSGEVTVKRLWLKNLWEICRSSKQWPINVQCKNNVVHKIRPSVCYSEKGAKQFPSFSCLEHFLSAIEETVYTNTDTHNTASGWKRRMQKAYSSHYGKSIEIPRWEGIKKLYTGED